MAIKRYRTTGQIVSQIKNGWHHEYYADGSIKSSGKYNNNQMDGEWKFYSKGGKLNIIKHFNNDVLHGAFVKYNKNGIITEHKEYENGKVVFSKNL